MLLLSKLFVFGSGFYLVSFGTKPTFWVLFGIGAVLCFLSEDKPKGED